MSEWKTGEPMVEGWYWVWDGAVVFQAWSDPAFGILPLRWRTLGSSWADGSGEYEWSDDWRWQGPLTPPSPPE